jgi:hypothetical protein
MWRFIFDWRYALLACLVLVATVVVEYSLLTRPELRSDTLVQNDTDRDASDLDPLPCPLWNQYKKIKMEMKAKQVKEILGPPDWMEPNFGPRDDSFLLAWKDADNNEVIVWFTKMSNNRDECPVMAIIYLPRGKQTRSWEFIF